jgi:hypothetical protein
MAQIVRMQRGDRRDADLMWECTNLRQVGAYFNVRQFQTLAGEDGLALRGRVYQWVSPKYSDGCLIGAGGP